VAQDPEIAELPPTSRHFYALAITWTPASAVLSICTIGRFIPPLLNHARNDSAKPGTFLRRDASRVGYRLDTVITAFNKPSMSRCPSYTVQ
jgi:hypothetical protein